MNERSSILVVDDEFGPRKSLEMILSPPFEVFSAGSSEKAIKILETENIDVVTLDLRLDQENGIDLLREIKRKWVDTEIIIITGFPEFETAKDAVDLGAFSYLLKPFKIGDVLSTVKRALEKKTGKDRLKDFLKEIGLRTGLDKPSDAGDPDSGGDPSLLARIKKILKTFNEKGREEIPFNQFEFSRALIEAVESRDPYASGHSSRVHYFSNLIAQRLDMGDQVKEDLQVGAYLHDIGKMGVPIRIVGKKGKYTDAERETVRKHPLIGTELVSSLELTPDVVSIIRHHHENYIGNGYPDGLKGAEIPILARIVSVADAFDAMVSNYPYKYREALSLVEAKKELRHQSYVQFDPEIANVMIDLIENEKEKVLFISSIISDE